MKLKKDKILIVSPLLSSFIKNDLEFLSENYLLDVSIDNWKSKSLTPLLIVKQFFVYLFKIPFKKAIIIHFGGYWALIPTILGKMFNTPVYIVIHGTGAAAIPSIYYGNLRKKLLKLFCKLSYQNAKQILPVSESLMKTKNTYYSDNEESYQGILNHFPTLKTKYTVIPNGIDTSFWNRDAIRKEENSFVAVFNDSQFVLKGGDIILESAKKFPNYSFYIIGCNRPKNIECPKNLHFLGFQNKQTLKEYYSKCQFHFQLSIYEGFGVAICEAMLCECIPIGSSVNHLPNIIGDTGFILEKRSSMELQTLIEKATTLSNNEKKNLGVSARLRIIENYSQSNRQKSLENILEL